MNDQANAAARRNNVANIYPLSPMQEGLLYHSVAAPDAGVYMPQIVLHLEGKIDVRLLRAAWQDLLARHTVLRSGFHWEERDQPFQVVYRDLDLSWQSLDWQGVSGDEQADRLSVLLENHRKNPFELRRPPLMRLHWIATGDSKAILVFSYHHLILDGWSASQLIRESFQLYLDKTGKHVAALPLPKPYADYIAWLKRQNREAAKNFWDGYLSKLQKPAMLFAQGKETRQFNLKEWKCPSGMFEQLKASCKAAGVTLNTALQAAVGLMLANNTGNSDVVFGSTVAGRPASLANAAQMIGLFINTLPVRVVIDPQQTVGNWLFTLQARQAETVEHEYLPLREIQADRGAMFDVLLIFESYPVSKELGAETGFRIKSVNFDEWTHYPFTLFVTVGDEGLTLTARYSIELCGEANASRHLAELGENLKLIIDHSSSLATLLKPQITQPAIETVAVKTVSDPIYLSRDRLNTATEKLLASTWAEILKRPTPGPADNFFELGGHSLLAARVISKMRRELEIELPVKSLFDRPVLGDLAAYIDALRTSKAPVPVEGHREIEL